MKERWSLSKERMISQEEGLDCTDTDKVTIPRPKNEANCDRIFRRCVKLLALIFYLELILLVGWAGIELFLKPYYAPSNDVRLSDKLSNGSVNDPSKTLSPNDHFVDSTYSSIKDALYERTATSREDDVILGGKYKPTIESVGLREIIDKDTASLGATTAVPMNDYHVDSTYSSINDGVDERTVAFREDRSTTESVGPQEVIDEDTASLEATTSRERDSSYAESSDEILEQHFSSPWAIYRRENSDTWENSDEATEISRELNDERFGLLNRLVMNDYNDDFNERFYASMIIVPGWSVNIQHSTNDAQEPSSNFEELTEDEFDRDDGVDEVEKSIDLMSLLDKTSRDEDSFYLGEKTRNNEDETISRDTNEPSAVSESLGNRIVAFDDSNVNFELSSSKEESVFELMGMTKLSSKSDFKCYVEYRFTFSEFSIVRCWPKDSLYRMSDSFIDIVRDFSASSEGKDYLITESGRKFVSIYEPESSEGKDHLAKENDCKFGSIGDSLQASSEGKDSLTTENDHKFDSIRDSLQASSEEKDYLTTENNRKFGTIGDSLQTSSEGKDSLTTENDHKFDSIRDSLQASSEEKDYLTTENN